MEYIKRESAMKAFYYLMTVDENIASEEMNQFDEIGAEIVGEDFQEKKEQIIEQCEQIIQSITEDTVRYDVISEELDKALLDKTEKFEEGISPRHLLWNLLVMAYEDECYLAEENRIIGHVARVLQIDKSILLEMRQTLNVLLTIQKELDELRVSDRPYYLIRPRVDEIEKKN